MDASQPTTKTWIAAQIPTIKQQLQTMQAKLQEDTQTITDLRQDIANKQAELSVRESNLVRDQRAITVVEGNLNAFTWIVENAPENHANGVDTPAQTSDNAAVIDGNDHASSS